MQVDDISLLELTKLRDVIARVCQVNVKEMFSGEATTHEDHQSFPEEMPVGKQSLWQSDDRQGVGLLVTYEHLRLGTIVIKGHHQTVGCQGSTSRPLTRIYYKNTHFF